MISTVVMSFFRWNGFISSEPEFAGISNYARIFTQDPVFWPAFRNTVIWLILSLLVPTALGLLLALALNRRMFGRNVFRSAIYIPGVVASIAAASIWVWVYNPNSGLVNQVLRHIGLGSLAQDWLGNQQLALYAVFIASVWQGVGFSLILYLAGLQNVPAELIEAARVDGAGPIRIFRAVTWPALRPTTIVVIVLTLIGSLKVFDLIVGMTRGGPVQSTQVLALWSYTQSFGNHLFGVGNAIATVLFLISMVLVIPYLIWSLRGDEE
ncbi:carbohydrate ABC transporter permease [Plantibacter sp. CFBP 8804]|uniref:carbohydrate ABC transporter permease n=1 Tax=Plantibacter sp. CFBP 8804 TaxID=2775270 RepID=UPI001FCE91FB|nr:sugar ABC transporter permease [Plantibacter sp. CFBP 8804]